MKEALFKPEMGILWQVMAKFETKYVFDILIRFPDKWEKWEALIQQEMGILGHAIPVHIWKKRILVWE